MTTRTTARPRDCLLIVDDEAPVRRALVRELVQDFEVVEAADYREALEVLERRPEVAAVVSDNHLVRGPSGYELLRAVRRRWPDVVRVMVSGHLTPEIKASGVAHRCIAKPWSSNAVRRALEEHLDRGVDPAPAPQTTPAKGKPAPAASRAVPASGSFEGHLFPILLNSLFSNRATGQLTVWQEDISKAIFFKDGLPVAGRSSIESESLCAMLERNGVISSAACQHARQAAKETGGRATDILLASGELPPHQLFEAYQANLREAIVQIFDWEVVCYEFHSLNDDLPDLTITPLEPARLIIDGIARWDERRVARTCGGPLARAGFERGRSPYNDQQLRLTTAELRILGLARDGHTTAEIMHSLPEGAGVIQLLGALVSLEAIRVIRRPSSPAPRVTAPQVSVLERPALSRRLDSNEIERFHEEYDRLMSLDYLELLGVGSRPTTMQLKNSYQSLVRRFHPDRCLPRKSRPSAELRDLSSKVNALFGRIQEAYETLRDPELRRRYLAKTKR